MSAELRRRPPERTLRWVTDSIGAGSRIASMRRLTEGGWHANHALTVVDRHGRPHRLVLRRWARPEWELEDPDFTAEREARVLELLSASSLPTPAVVAADSQAAACDVPTLLLGHLPGRPPGLPRDMGSFLSGLAQALREIHAVSGPAAESVPPYRRYYDPERLEAPAWSRRPELWEGALALACAEPPPGPRGFIHRDFHPENTLWWRGRLTGVIDWTSASWGPAAVDMAHMRWNLAVTYGIDAADEFLRLARLPGSDTAADQRYWDVVTVCDLLPEVQPEDWPAFDLERLERYVAGTIRRPISAVS
jgi:aminoglycoside phosphotransferase (APT) family kinase protein